MRTFRTDSFSVNRTDKVMSTELSDLNVPVGFGEFSYPEDRIYTDACDVGCKFRSHKTGIETTWYLDHCDRNKDNEIEGYWFFPTPETLKARSGLRGWRVLLIND